MTPTTNGKIELILFMLTSYIVYIVNTNFVFIVFSLRLNSTLKVSLLYLSICWDEIDSMLMFVYFALDKLHILLYRLVFLLKKVCLYAIKKRQRATGVKMHY